MGKLKIEQGICNFLLPNKSEKIKNAKKHAIKAVKAVKWTDMKVKKNNPNVKVEELKNFHSKRKKTPT